MPRCKLDLRVLQILFILSISCFSFTLASDGWGWSRRFLASSTEARTFSRRTVPASVWTGLRMRQNESNDLRCLLRCVYEWCCEGVRFGPDRTCEFGIVSSADYELTNKREWTVSVSSWMSYGNISHSPEYAIDGAAADDHEYWHPAYIVNEWLQVDLSVPQKVTRVNLESRHDAGYGTTDRIVNIEIRVGNESAAAGTRAALPAANPLCTEDRHPDPPGETWFHEFPCEPSPAVGRFVQVQKKNNDWWDINEVHVHVLLTEEDTDTGDDVDVYIPNSPLMAEYELTNKNDWVATGSTIHNSDKAHPPEYAIDGVANHTRPFHSAYAHEDEWLQVDLGKAYTVTAVSVEALQMDMGEVRVGDVPAGPGRQVLSENPVCAVGGDLPHPPPDNQYYFHRFRCDDGPKRGRFVQVRRTQNGTGVPVIVDEVYVFVACIE